MRNSYLAVWLGGLAFAWFARGPWAYVAFGLLFVPGFFLRIARAVYRRTPASEVDGGTHALDVSEEADGLLTPVLHSGREYSDAFARLLSQPPPPETSSAADGETPLREYTFLRPRMTASAVMAIVAVSLVVAVLPASHPATFMYPLVLIQFLQDVASRNEEQSIADLYPKIPWRLWPTPQFERLEFLLETEFQERGCSGISIETVGTVLDGLLFTASGSPVLDE